MRRVTIVTGGGRGIGAAVCTALAADGHDVGVVVREDLDAAERVAADVRDRGTRAVVVRADVRRADEVHAAFDVVADALGPVTGLVANAGTTGPLGVLADLPVEELQRVVDTNVVGALLCAREAVRRMATSRGGPGGAIVALSSVAATLGSAGEYVHYAATKAAVDAMTIGLAKEVAADGIRVNAVAPGTVRTDIHARAGDAGRPDRVAARIPLGRPGEPDEVAPAVRWLLSSEASYVTGAILRVGGGL